MNRAELREKLNKIDCENFNQYDLVNLFESVKLSDEDLNKLSKIVNNEKAVYNFLNEKAYPSAVFSKSDIVKSPKKLAESKKASINEGFNGLGKDAIERIKELESSGKVSLTIAKGDDGEDFLIVDSYDDIQKLQSAIDPDFEPDDRYDTSLLYDTWSGDWGFQDEYAVCNLCGKAIRTSPDSYSWTPDYFADYELGEMVCGDCVREDPTNYLNSLINNPDNANTILDRGTLRAEGFELIEDDYENGWYDRSDSPEGILKDAMEEHPNAEFIFSISGQEQFRTNFELWGRGLNKTLGEGANSMSSAVERQTNGYKKTKGQIQCNGGEQAEEVEDLLKAKYDNVTTQKGKGGKVIIKFSKNESLGEETEANRISPDDIRCTFSDKGCTVYYKGKVVYSTGDSYTQGIDYWRDEARSVKRNILSGNADEYIMKRVQKIDSDNGSLGEGLDEDESLSESSNGNKEWIWDNEGNRKYRVVYKNAECDVYSDWRNKGKYILDRVDGKRVEKGNLTKAEVKNMIRSIVDEANEPLSESNDAQSKIDELEERIQKLVKRYQSAQKQYHGDSALSKRIEAEISGLEDEQRKLRATIGKEESLSEAQERQAKIEVRKVYSWYNVYVDNALLLKHLSEEDAKEIMKTMDDNNYPYIYREAESAKEYDLMSKEQGYVTEDTVKQGTERTIAYLKDVCKMTKKEDADETIYSLYDGDGKFIMSSPNYRKIYREYVERTIPYRPKGAHIEDDTSGGLFEDANSKIDPNTLSDDYVLLDSKAENQTDKDTDLYYDCIKEFCMIDEIDYEDMEVTFITNQRDADDWDEETFKTDYTYTPDDEEVALECANDYLVKKYPDKITVGDIKKSADDVYKEVKDFFYEQAQKEAEEAHNLSDFQEQLKEDKAKETMKSVVAKWRSRRSNKSAD